MVWCWSLKFWKQPFHIREPKKQDVMQEIRHEYNITSSTCLDIAHRFFQLDEFENSYSGKKKHPLEIQHFKSEDLHGNMCNMHQHTILTLKK